MGLEEDFFETMKYAKVGGKVPVNKMIQEIMRNTQIGALKKLRADIDKMIDEIVKKQGKTRGMDDLDPFKILGVDPDATEEVVRKAYRKKAAEVHPDRGGSNEEMMKVNLAWEAIRRFKGWS